ncbi:MAG: imidazole glycerol phosphate synthase subunit HisH [Thaumarchaeota archaeon]|nr:imidazole glycerol phosphate synthase subunit HisH [Candidatus Calditenuaceae archaeon]MDW8187555.1 imidazole glycerol phosphate synthase subunit HisH [Nitrososphaerota archaeon]
MTRLVRIGVLNYGVGNLFSVVSGLRRLGAEVDLLESLSGVEPDGLVLPGVGNFTEGAKNIHAHREKVIDLVDAGTPTLGICLGMQLLFEESEEGEGKGLSLFRGKVVKLRTSAKLPHIGWNRLLLVRRSELLEDVSSGEWVYFVHTFAPDPHDESIVLSLTHYGDTDFPSVVGSNNLFGTQFHPEKSGETGKKILRNFVKLCVRR